MVPDAGVPIDAPTPVTTIKNRVARLSSTPKTWARETVAVP